MEDQRLAQSKASTMKWAYLLAVLILVTAFVGIYAFSREESIETRLVWGSVQTGTVIATRTELVPTGENVTFLSVQQPDSHPPNATIVIPVNHSECYRVGAAIFYQVSSIDRSIGTQRVRLVDPPIGCVSPTA